MQTPTVIVTQKGAARARAGHPWIFRADVQGAPDGLTSGAEVRIADARKNFIARQPMGRLAQAHEMAPLVVFLASDKSVFVTGQLYANDGGMTI